MSDFEKEMAERASGFLKAELKRRSVTYEQLAEKLTEMGMPETRASIASKLLRGTFPAVFLIASLKAVGCPQIRLEDV